jgi:hypothetical protein
MKTVVRAVFSGTISTGAFENEKPLFEIAEEFDAPMTDEAIAGRQKELYELCKQNFSAQSRISLQDKIKMEQEGIRLYPIAEKNKEYPSVTSIMSWDKSFNMPDTELAQYASRGTLVHALCEEFDETGKWLDLKALIVKKPDLYKDWVIMTKGNRQLNVDGYDYPAFLKAYPIEHIASEEVIVNHEHEFAGRLDKVGTPEGGAWLKLGVKPIHTVFDFKTSHTVTEEAYGAQLSAYARTKGLSQAVIIPLRNSRDVKRGFSAPVVVNVDKYYPRFLEARQLFRKRFGI